MQIASPIAIRFPAVPGFQRKDMDIRIGGRAWQSGRHGSALVLNAFVNLQPKSKPRTLKSALKKANAVAGNNRE